MKAYDAVTFLVAFNIVISIAMGLGVWGVGGLSAMGPETQASGIAGTSFFGYDLTDLMTFAIAIMGAILVSLGVSYLFPKSDFKIGYALITGFFVGLWIHNGRIIGELQHNVGSFPLQGIFNMMGILLFITFIAQSMMGGWKSHE